ncbi:hypothetical protein [Helicobacter sp.]|uniref:hypothetical protein n=1 Tax=Helicobacter sp. TaxID=218 RepID=UPI0025B801AA|nr:hypothetical protein [Helicobacter sp.]MBR2495144.1 hypothetical protein [Helicobacter sp.]
MFSKETSAIAERYPLFSKETALCFVMLVATEKEAGKSKLHLAMTEGYAIGS